MARSAVELLLRSRLVDEPGRRDRSEKRSVDKAPFLCLLTVEATEGARGGSSVVDIADVEVAGDEGMVLVTGRTTSMLTGVVSTDVGFGGTGGEAGSDAASTPPGVTDGDPEFFRFLGVLTLLVEGVNGGGVEGNCI